MKMKNLRSTCSILLFLAAIGFFIVSIITRQVSYVPIGFLFLISGMNLSRREKDSTGEANESEDNDQVDNNPEGDDLKDNNQVNNNPEDNNL